MNKYSFSHTITPREDTNDQLLIDVLDGLLDRYIDRVPDAQRIIQLITNRGDMIINDHINLMPNPLIGPNIEVLGPRFPDMSEPYCKKMIKQTEYIAKINKINIHKGTYVALTGPTLETPAEYQYMRIIGGDTVGMSTVPEVIVARHMNIFCFAISVITDLGIPGEIKEVSHSEIQKIAENTEPKLTKIIKKLIASI